MTTPIQTMPLGRAAARQPLLCAVGPEHTATRLHLDKDRAGTRGSPRTASLAGAKTDVALRVSPRCTALTTSPTSTQNT
jgi:hypothetical protein